MVTVPVSLLSGDARPPVYAHPGDAGCDLVATERVELAAGGGRGAVRCGVAVAIPEGHAGFVLPRSGLALHHGITCLNAPGLIDAGFRGEVRCILVNTDATTDYVVEPGDRVAQLVIQRVEHASFVVAEVLDETARGGGGFGSTGVSS